jgi:6-pyruvoyltetrahydropterin/6-carboxytetrahydropterin synthase
VRVWAQAATLDPLGMVLDFADVKRALEDAAGPFDHRFLNEIPPFDERNTTAELLAEHLFAELARRLDDGRVRVTRVEVWENDGACAAFERPAGG